MSCNILATFNPEVFFMILVKETGSCFVGDKFAQPLAYCRI
ncbi:uncharacterized protein RAG0_14179 [Rhynchosporium agropyri]|uniref:Uncharacterized protein n=1 Tax=Rhynchosporium agropyri TaxID=914238 RepID=A0A1E1LFT0_9HELO|nr:uncharacterized protein RAG0_14179 [Rhynchosporium agropyri]